MEQNWIFEENLLSWLEIVASFCGYDFEAGDRDAFEFGIQNMNHGEDCWFDYKFSGFCSVELQVARDVGTCVVFVEIHCSPELQPKIMTATQIAQEYQIIKR